MLDDKNHSEINTLCAELINRKANECTSVVEINNIEKWKGLFCHQLTFMGVANHAKCQRTRKMLSPLLYQALKVYAVYALVTILHFWE